MLMANALRRLAAWLHHLQSAVGISSWTGIVVPSILLSAPSLAHSCSLSRGHGRCCVFSGAQWCLALRRKSPDDVTASGHTRVLAKEKKNDDGMD
jgi:hypothetical protein